MVDSQDLFDLLYIKCIYKENLDLSKFDKDEYLIKRMLSPTITKIEIKDIIKDDDNDDEKLYNNFSSGPRTKEVIIYGITNTEDKYKIQWKVFIVKAIIASKHKVDSEGNIINPLYKSNIFDYFIRSLYDTDNDKSVLRSVI